LLEEIVGSREEGRLRRRRRIRKKSRRIGRRLGLIGISWIRGRIKRRLSRWIWTHGRWIETLLIRGQKTRRLIGSKRRRCLGREITGHLTK